MRGGLPLFRFRGIRVLVHWTFLLLPAYVAFTGFLDGTSLTEVLVEIGLVLIVFVCVVLHEFGHALTAQRFGVGTRDITLLPIGGVASLERMPEDPRQEFWITIAGPMVNLVIAGLSFLLIALSGLSLLMGDMFKDLASGHTVLAFLFMSNLGLFLFNLIPAFPMDGGRILRSVLSMRMARDKATRIATTIGRLLAVGFVGYGLLQSAPFLAVIGVFIFMAAGAEARHVAASTKLNSLIVGDVMRTDVLQLEAGTGLQSAWNAMTFGEHRVIVVTADARYSGMVLREVLRSELAQGDPAAAIGPLALNVAPIAPSEPALALYRRMLATGVVAVPVVDSGTIVGIAERSAMAGIFHAQHPAAR
ncbi:MAG TPA: site-2 protease family protein [Flavobacteriales bacterium]|nr:site-2 protease family protein [Flavobacteriales bacterium]